MTKTTIPSSKKHTEKSTYHPPADRTNRSHLLDIFQNQFSLNTGLDISEINTSVQVIQKTPISNRLFASLGTLAQIIKRLLNHKAPGHDKISKAALKNLPPKEMGSPFNQHPERLPSPRIFPNSIEN